MDQPLFRREAIEARRQGWLGTITLVQPTPLWVFAVAFALAALAIGLFLGFGEYTQRSRVTGQLVPDLGLSTVVAPAAGIVERIYRREGDRVGAGMSLAVVAIPRATASGADAQAGIDSGIDRRREALVRSDASQTALAAAQERGLRRQLAAAGDELEQAAEQAANRGRQVSLARETLERYRTLGAQGYVSQLQVRQQEQAYLDQVGARQDLARQVADIQRQMAELEQSLHELPAHQAVQSAATARDLALLDGEKIQNDASGELMVKAPVSGLLASRLIEPGQAVQAGQPIMSVLPSGSRLQAQLFVPSRAIGFIRPGDKVLLRYQAYPYQKFGHHTGVVARISRNALGNVELGAVAGASQSGEPYYRVLVDLAGQSVTAYGKQEPLRPGMLLDADILGEHRKLYEWALEPLYSITGTL